MRRPLRLLSTLAAGIVTVSVAQAQDAMILSGTIDESSGQDGFVMRFDDTDIAVATGQLYDDNPALVLSEGDRVTVYAMPDAAMFADRLIEADGLYVASSGELVRIGESALDDDAYATMSLGDAGEPTESDGSWRGPSAFSDIDRNRDGVATLEEYVRAVAASSDVSRREATRLFEVLARGDRRLTKREFQNPPARFERLLERFSG